MDAASTLFLPVGYGQYGEGYIRISITTPDDRLDEALRRMEGWKPTPAP